MYTNSANLINIWNLSIINLALFDKKTRAQGYVLEHFSVLGGVVAFLSDVGHSLRDARLDPGASGSVCTFSRCRTSKGHFAPTFPFLSP